MFTDNSRASNYRPQPQSTPEDSSHAIVNPNIADHHSNAALAHETAPCMPHPTISIESPNGYNNLKRHNTYYPCHLDQGCDIPESMRLSEYATPSKRPRTQDTAEYYQHQLTSPHNEQFVDATVKIGHREPRSLLNLPFELIVMILWRVSNPLDLWSVSQVNAAIRGLIDERLWQNLYISQTPVWSSHIQINNLTGGVKMWSRIVLGDYLRRTLRWAEVSGNLPQAVEDKKLLRANLGTCLHYRPSHMHPAISVSSAESQQWRNVGPPALFKDQSTDTTLAAYMQARACVGCTDHQITVYGGSDYNSPIAIIPSNFWVDESANRQLEPEITTENLGPARLKDIKHFPIKDGVMRVVFVVAFGERNQMPADADDQDMYTDVWSLLRIFEVYIQPEFSSYGSLIGSIPSRGRVETIVPRSRHIQIFKIYSAINQSSGQTEDRIALIGIHQGSRSQTVLMTSPLLATPPPIVGDTKGRGSSVGTSSLECHVLGGMQALEPSCMALFPAQSDFEHLVVILDRHGNGEIWDWMRRVRVSVLKLRASEDLLPHRESLHYWGVHVSWAIEEPVCDESASPLGLGLRRRTHGDFRIVAISCGEENEWECCWWNINEKELRKHLNQEPVPIALSQRKAHLTSGPILDSGAWTNELTSTENAPRTASQNMVHSVTKSVPLPEIWTIESSSRHFENCTHGVLYPLHNSSIITLSSQQLEVDGVSGSPLTFDNFQIWGHYRIALTEEHGICIFDMDQEDSCDILNDHATGAPQWVTMIEDTEEDPLIDIATVGNCLLLTRKYSHM
ncbi:hypothetical protein BGX21_004548, partial [Mortierella sp. AD011]